MVDRAILKRAAEKLARRETLTASEKKAHDQWKAQTEAEWRERIYRDVPLKDVRRLLGGKTAKQVAELAAKLGLPIAGHSSDLFAVFSAFDDLSQKLADGRLRKSNAANVASTQADAIHALADRGITVSIRTLRDWFSVKGCPGKTEQGYDIDAIEQWAAVNSDKTAEDSEETRSRARQLNQQIKEQELEIKRLKAADMQRADDAARGNILALSDCIELITAIVAVARTELMAVPKEVASIATDTGLQQQIVTEGSQRVAKILDSLAAKLARVPQQVREDDE